MIENQKNKKNIFMTKRNHGWKWDANSTLTFILTFRNCTKPEKLLSLKYGQSSGAILVFLIAVKNVVNIKVCTQQIFLCNPKGF